MDNLDDEQRALIPNSLRELTLGPIHTEKNKTK